MMSSVTRKFGDAAIQTILELVDRGDLTIGSRMDNDHTIHIITIRFPNGKYFSVNIATKNGEVDAGFDILAMNFIQAITNLHNFIDNGSLRHFK